MSFTENTPNNNAEQSTDIMDVTTVFNEGEDPVILTKLAIDNGEKKQLQCNKDLWPMITYLHSRLQAVIADNQALHAEVKILKASKLSTDGKIGDVQDECRTTRHKIFADIQSIKSNQPTLSTAVMRTNQSKTPQNYAAAAASSNNLMTISKSSSALQGDASVISRPRAEQAISTQPEWTPPTDPSLDVGSQVDADQPSTLAYTVVSRQRRRPPVMRGNLTASTVDNNEGKDGLFDLVKLSHQPFKDFCVKGIPNVEHTKFKDDQMLPDISKYNEAVKEELTKKGIKVRFVKVFLHKEGDLRGTTVARIGGYVADERKIMDAGLWPPNVTVRPWQYLVSNTSTVQSKN